jgi:MoaA/NifB/PqqE/SkfB family radical SAM enzyme
VQKPEEKIPAIRSARGLSPGQPICLAADAGMYFAMNGVIAVCCYNHVQALGEYPRTSVQDAWDSIVRRELRDQLARNELPSGCGYCREQVRAGNAGGMLARRFDRFQGISDPSTPRIMEFELGNLCNLECVMCKGSCSSAIRANRDKADPTPVPYDEEFVRQLHPFIPGLLSAEFLGGEPFLNPLNFRIWDLFIELNPKVSVAITTNGTVLNDRVKQVLGALRPHIVVSLESLVPAHYEAIRKNASFATLQRNLAWLLQHKHLSGIAVCPLRNNWRDLPEIVSFCNTNGLILFFNTVFEPEALSLRTMPSRELMEVAEYLESAHVQTGFSVARGDGIDWEAENGRSYTDLIRQVWSWLDRGRERNDACRLDH